jgi:hypothetical protein
MLQQMVREGLTVYVVLMCATRKGIKLKEKQEQINVHYMNRNIHRATQSGRTAETCENKQCSLCNLLKLAFDFCSI